MKKTITINISGFAFTIEDEAFEKLDSYLSQIRNHLKQEVDEIVADIEFRIAELFRASCPTTAEIVTTTMVDEVISIIGQPSEFGEAQESGHNSTYQGQSKTANHETTNAPTAKRLYRDPVNRVFGGVCSGLSAYFDIDVVAVRVIFVILTLFGLSILLYIGLWIAMPPAYTMVQRNEMMGGSANFQRTEAASNATGYNQYQRNPIHDATSTLFHGIARGIAVIFGIVFTIIGLSLLTLLTLLVFGPQAIPGWADLNIPDIWISAHKIVSHDELFLFQMSIALLAGIPLLMLVYGGTRLIFDLKKGGKWIGVTAFLLWLAALFTIIYFTVRTAPQFRQNRHILTTNSLNLGNYKKIYIEPMASDTIEKHGQNRYKNRSVNITINGKTIYAANKPQLTIIQGNKQSITIEEHINFPIYFGNDKTDWDTDPLWQQKDSIIRLRACFPWTHEETFVPKTVTYTIEVPNGYSVEINPLLKSLMNVE